MGKVNTPAWILEGYDSEDAYNKKKGVKAKKKEGKTFKIRKCPKCGSDKVNVLLGKEEGRGTGEWACTKCKWIGKNIKEDEVTEEEFMKYLDDKGEEVA
jgi:hypothetical protein